MLKNSLNLVHESGLVKNLIKSKNLSPKCQNTKNSIEHLVNFQNKTPRADSWSYINNKRN